MYVFRDHLDPVLSSDGINIMDVGPEDAVIFVAKRKDPSYARIRIASDEWGPSKMQHVITGHPGNMPYYLL